MMNRKFVIFFLLIIPSFLWAQKQQAWNKPLYDAYPMHFGFAFTAGVLDYSVTHSEAFITNKLVLSPITFNNVKYDSVKVYSIEGNGKAIFGASIVGNLRLNDNWDLRFIPGLSFGQRDMTYLLTRLNSATNTVDTVSHTMKIESTFLQFPLMIKYRAIRESNYRPYLIAGLNYTIDLAAQKKIKAEEMPKIRLNRQDILVEMGFGIDYYLPYFKFTTELRFSYGLMNMVNYDDTQLTTAFDRLGTKMVTLSIYFE